MLVSEIRHLKPGCGITVLYTIRVRITAVRLRPARHNKIVDTNCVYYFIMSGW